MDLTKSFIGEVLFSERVKIGDSQMVKIQGKFDGLGLFEQYVNEKLVPDSIEGKKVKMVYEIGLIKFKPLLRLKSIEILDENVPF